MKKSLLVVALPLLALSALLLSGCGMFRSEKAWEKAKQETPLEIPPGLDTPSSNAALVIPEQGANNPTSNGATARTGNTGNQIADGFVLNDTVENTYRRLAQALEKGDIGTVVSHDDDAHTYALNVIATDEPSDKKGFFSSMFNGKSKKTEDAPGATPRQVQLTVSSSGEKASEVRAQGDAAAVAKVIDTLKGRLGGG
ncbi:MAG TPA: hypothetical protein VFG49_07270 [Dyella sp.]|uniref:hypothetical protein n=1 Tax=Dyella sp. TaxID=1869338 RepID=UPI002D766462|nr:hypothetical protein [Dyella sp.]HET6553323.1 hypothetical protein [Dyella sp.]